MQPSQAPEDFMKITNLLLKKVAVLLLWIVIFLFLFSAISVLFREGLSDINILYIFDTYLKLILSSWPAVFLVFIFLLFFKHHHAIDHFIRNRMTDIGFDGVKAEVITTPANDVEVSVKNLLDAQDVDQTIPELGKIPNTVTLEESVPRQMPNTIEKFRFDRYQKSVQIENLAHELLKSRFDTYRPNIKITKEGKSLTLDGVVTTYAGNLEAVEIKYINARGSYLSIKYILSKLRERLLYFDIKKLHAVIIADDLNADDATEINNSFGPLGKKIKKMYFSHKDGNLNEVFPKKENLKTQPIALRSFSS